MKCIKLNLQERSKIKLVKTNTERPRRFCQKRMVNPEHEEDPRWTDMFDRFYCKDVESCDLNETTDSGTQHVREDLCLSVQNLQFLGNVEQRKRVRSSFKYKTLLNNQKHRMFVKQIVDDVNQNYLARTSELSDYADDYTKFFNNDQSRPSSGKSSIVLFCLNNKCKENKSIQVDLRKQDLSKKNKIDRVKKSQQSIKPAYNCKAALNNNNNEETKITFHNNGKRKSLTISRNESPATVQVIRVDVICNYSSRSSMSDYDQSEKQCTNIELEQEDKENQMVPKKTSRLANKYMLTKTMKTLDEKIAGGKVTLMCKTYKLNERSKMLDGKKKSAIPS